MEVPDELLGRRVALRHRVGERAGREVFSDAVGELATSGPDELEVATRRGPVRVARSAVTAVRAVPPAAPRRASWSAVARLDQLCADAWPAPVDRPLGAWRLRAAGNYTGRANTALALGDPGRPVAQALADVRGFAAEHGIRPLVHAPVGSPWHRAVTEQGWVLAVDHPGGSESAVLVADLASGSGTAGQVRLGTHADHPDLAALVHPAGPTAVSAPAAPPGAASTAPSDSATGPDYGADQWTIIWAPRPQPAWWRLGPADPPSPVQRALIDPDPPPTGLTLGFGLVTASDGATVGHLRAAVVADHLHLSLLAVAQAARHRGIGRSLLLAAAGWGRDRGARWAVLQVATHNTPALELYRSVGFTEHHRYHYLAPVPE